MRLDPSDALEFATGGFLADTRAWELRGDTVVFRFTSQHSEDRSPTDSVRRVPTASEWRAFWSAVDRAGVARWREGYRAEDVVDGSGWRLLLAGGGYRVESSGSNAYPDRRGRESEIEVTEAFRTFREALAELAGLS